MNEPARAMIRWLPLGRGGRTAPPAGPQYTTVARFEDARDRWPDEAWSVVIEPVQLFGDEAMAALSDVRFLSPDAPGEFLAAGARFELREGPRVVAKGVVLPSEVAIPSSLDEFALALLG